MLELEGIWCCRQAALAIHPPCTTLVHWMEQEAALRTWNAGAGRGSGCDCGSAAARVTCMQQRSVGRSVGTEHQPV